MILFCLVVALVFILLEAFRTPSKYVSFGWLGLFFFVITFVVPFAQHSAHHAHF